MRNSAIARAMGILKLVAFAVVCYYVVLAYAGLSMLKYSDQPEQAHENIQKVARPIGELIAGIIRFVFNLI